MNSNEATAFHQAGHAVAALYHQLSFDQITLDVEECLGMTLLEQCTQPGWENEPKHRQEAALIVILAGEMAEKKAASKLSKRVGIEAGWVIEVLSALEGSEDIARAYYRYLALKTQALLDHPYVWETTEKVAGQLLQTHSMDFVQLKCLWHKVDAQTGKFLAGEPAQHHAPAFG
jgi:hypothetical protein